MLYNEYFHNVNEEKRLNEYAEINRMWACVRMYWYSLPDAGKIGYNPNIEQEFLSINKKVSYMFNEEDIHDIYLEVKSAYDKYILPFKLSDQEIRNLRSLKKEALRESVFEYTIPRVFKSLEDMAEKLQAKYEKQTNRFAWINQSESCEEIDVISDLDSNLQRIDIVVKLPKGIETITAEFLKTATFCKMSTIF